MSKRNLVDVLFWNGFLVVYFCIVIYLLFFSKYTKIVGGWGNQTSSIAYGYINEPYIAILLFLLLAVITILFVGQFKEKEMLAFCSMSGGFFHGLFCRHDWKQVFNEADEATNYGVTPFVRPVAVFECVKCGKTRAASEAGK